VSGRGLALLLAVAAAPWHAEAALAQSPGPGAREEAIAELVVPLVGDDGRTHYVTFWQYEGGAVRIRLSLFAFAAGPYNVVVFDRGGRRSTGDFGPGDVLAQFPLEQPEPAGLVLHIFETHSFSILPGAVNTLLDANGGTLAIYRPGSGGSGLLAACADVGQPPGSPAAGTGTAAVSVRSSGVILAGFALLSLAAALANVDARERREGPPP
jgi:hypothetical protein